MTHTAHISHGSEGLSDKTKCFLQCGLASTKRISEKTMLNINSNYGGEKLSVVAGIDRNISNNLTLHFVPIHLEDG